MKQNIGLIFQTIGYIILSGSVFLDTVRRFINFTWKNKPTEIRMFCFFLGIRNDGEYKRLFSGKEFPMPENFSIKQRILLDLPLIALIFIITGLFLTFK